MNGSASQPAKKTQKSSSIGVESGPPVAHASLATGTNTAAPSTKPRSQTIQRVTSVKRESRNSMGRNTLNVAPYEMMQAGTIRRKNAAVMASPGLPNTGAITAQAMIGT